MNTRSPEIIMAEQEVTDSAQRHWNTLGNLQPREPSWDSSTRTYRREKFAVLGRLDGLPIIETYRHGGGYKSEPELVPDCSYGERNYSLLTGVAPRNAMVLMRTIRLQDEGLDHILGIVEGNGLYGETLGIYVPTDVLEPMRSRHVEEIVTDYPCVSVGIDQIRKLNISPHFVYSIQSEIDLLIGENEPSKHVVKVRPVADGATYPSDNIPGESTDVTKFYIEKLKAPGIDLLERTKLAIGATSYQSSGYRKGENLNDLMFRCDRVLSNEEITQALQNLSNPGDQTYQVTLHRLSAKLRSLINLPLDKAVRSPDENIQNLEGLIHVSSAVFVLGMY